MHSDSQCPVFPGIARDCGERPGNLLRLWNLELCGGKRYGVHGQYVEALGVVVVSEEEWLWFVVIAARGLSLCFCGDF